MDVHISLIDRRDLAGEIYRQLRQAILDGRLRGGEALPPTRLLAARLNVSRTTVSVAYDRLIGEGYAAGRKGAGTFVARDISSDAAIRTTPSAALRPRELWNNVRLPTEIWRPARFDFRPGAPDERLFPYESWRRLLMRELRPRTALMYGEPAGFPPLRAAIARHLAVSRGVRADAEDVIVTSGAQQAIDLTARVLLSPGDRAVVEDPGYGPPRRLLRSLGFDVFGAPVDAEGLIVDALPPQTRLVYVTPSHQFPLGMSMSLQRRLALLEWARRADGAVIEDDYDSEFRFDGRPIEPLQMLDADGRVIYVGSFSKSLSPALRLGFLIAPASLRSALRAAKHLADWCVPLAIQAVMTRFLEQGLFARHVRRMRITYEARHRLICDILTRDFADELEIAPSNVGLHIAARARRASVERIEKVLERAEAAGFACLPLSFYAAGEHRQPGVILGYGAIAKERIEEGLGVLRAAFNAT